MIAGSATQSPAGTRRRRSRPEIAYWNGDFRELQEIHVSPLDRGFLFADGVYEVIRAYGGRPFAVDEHATRLRSSLRAIRMSWEGADALPDLVDRLLERNELSDEDALVYVQLTRGAAPREHAFPGPEVPLTAYAVAWPYRPERDPSEGVAAILLPDVRWSRCDIKSIALLPNVLARQQAADVGAAEAIFIRDGVVTEGTHTNVCAVIDDTLVTHPLTTHVLAGITRATVLALCESLGIPVREAPILAEDLMRASELLLVGTTMEVAPVTHLHGRRLAKGRVGPVARALQEAYRREVGG